MDGDATTKKLLLTVPEAAARLSLGRSKFLELLYAGAIPHVRIGRAVRVPAAALEEWVARQLAEAEADGGQEELTSSNQCLSSRRPSDA
jgi:excisionase family DNA binding protein